MQIPAQILKEPLSSYGVYLSNSSIGAAFECKSFQQSSEPKDDPTAGKLFANEVKQMGNQNQDRDKQLGGSNQNREQQNQQNRQGQQPGQNQSGQRQPGQNQSGSQSNKDRSGQQNQESGQGRQPGQSSTSTRQQGGERRPEDETRLDDDRLS